MCAAMVCAGAAAWVMAGRDRVVRRARRLLAEGGATGPVRSPWGWARAWCRARLRPEWWCLMAGVTVALIGESLVPLVVGSVGVPLAGRALRARTARQLSEKRTDAVIALCGALAGEVRAGRQPAEALLVAARDSGGLGGARAAVVAAARFGGDVPGALGESAREPGAEGLRGLAACWRVAVDRGAGLAAGLERLESALRAERDQRADLRAQLAGARSTAVLLAALPLLGLLLGTALGADPLRVLLHTGPGLGCLLVGGALEGAGSWWALRIVRGAERQ
ncbi:type II secretion system F family protein [Streptomyces himalayensis]|uniref:Type II secretion system F family protein n=1 Tax=Streptomyces himalayensis subsp. himalayensis TaxID=2756131 RepID=A0A7W0DHD4_9ACTN|nr:type II secretion system F family protein [Streptomyces himalayensis]MBA2945072.1 type II secretion system F family protein [Streptomyces himalayensis subsp. himalayensis]